MIYTVCRKTLQYKPVFAKVAIFVVLWSTTLALATYVYGHAKGFDTGANTLTDVEKSIIIREQDKFTPEKFKEYLVALNIKFPHIVYAQAVVETGNFKSHLFKTNQNMFGMKEAHMRATTNVGTVSGHAAYHHWRDCVVDYALFQCAFLSKIYTEEAYYQYLQENYAEEKNYVTMVKRMADKFKQPLK